MKTMLFDFHAHFSFKPANSPNFDTGNEPDPDHWRERLGHEMSSFAQIADKTVIKSSQLHGNACTTSGHRIICNGLYPLERGFISQALIKPIGTLTGFSEKALRDLLFHRISYFESLTHEYQNLLAHEQDATFSGQGNTYVLVNSFQEIVQHLTANPDTLCILNSVEGAHAFASDLRGSDNKLIPVLPAEKRHLRSLGNHGSGDPDFRRFVTMMVANIDHIKSQWRHVPLYVGLSHHYYNHIAGHSPSLGGVVDFFLNQDGATIDTQNRPVNFYYLGIHPWGHGVLNKLLSRLNSNGTPARRILIDVKHMSPQARLDYYTILDAMKQIDPAERVPVIKSHTAVSGRRNLKRTIDHDHVLMNDEREVSKYFYDGVINLFDDEIVRIINSDGLIGLMIDERRIMGSKIPPESGFQKKGDFNKVSKDSRKALATIVKCKNAITRLLKELSQNPPPPPAQVSEIQKKIKALQADLKAAEKVKNTTAPKLRPVYLAVILRQIFHILDLTGERGWDHLCIGTDYDGVINPIDIYPQSSEMVTILDDFVTFWESKQQSSDAEISGLYARHLYGKTAEHWIRRLLVLNGASFLKKYYNDTYLRDGVVPQRGFALTPAEVALLS